MAWFPSVAEAGNLVDARADYRRGEMLLKPDLAHHALLLKEIASRGFGAFRLFPNRLRLFWWAMRFFDPRRHISARVGLRQQEFSWCPGRLRLPGNNIVPGSRSNPGYTNRSMGTAGPRAPAALKEKSKGFFIGLSGLINAPAGAVCRPARRDGLSS